ncbi:MAG TPA: DUF2703 domain-containing protein [Nitrososphaeraceae archaeon]|nr:DUF2703 domain-containing protein [Nitrososphaeraceae archaeon]
MDNSDVSCKCSPSELIEKGSVANILKIKWKRLISKGETCQRCGSTEKGLRKAGSILKKSLAPLGIKVILEKEELSVTEFKKDPSLSNRIWINNRLLEDWIRGRVGHSPCCDVCSPHDCRTVEVEGQIYETIPAEIIIKAGLLAASQLVSPQTSNSYCCDA